jgi:hypothetical protein
MKWLAKRAHTRLKGLGRLGSGSIGLDLHFGSLGGKELLGEVKEQARKRRRRVRRFWRREGGKIQKTFRRASVEQDNRERANSAECGASNPQQACLGIDGDASKGAWGTLMGYVPDRYNSLVCSRVKKIQHVIDVAAQRRAGSMVEGNWPFARETARISGNDKFGPIDMIVWVPELIWAADFPHGAPACPVCCSSEHAVFRRWHPLVSRRYLSRKNERFCIKSVTSCEYTCLGCTRRFAAWDLDVVKLMPPHVQDSFPLIVSDALAFEKSMLDDVIALCRSTFDAASRHMLGRFLRSLGSIRMGLVFVPIGSLVLIGGALLQMQSTIAALEAGILSICATTYLVLHVISVCSGMLPAFIETFLPPQPITLRRETLLETFSWLSVQTARYFEIEKQRKMMVCSAGIVKEGIGSIGNAKEYFAGESPMSMKGRAAFC